MAFTWLRSVHVAVAVGDCALHLPDVFFDQLVFFQLFGLDEDLPRIPRKNTIDAVCCSLQSQF